MHVSIPDNLSNLLIPEPDMSSLDFIKAIVFRKLKIFGGNLPLVRHISSLLPYFPACYFALNGIIPVYAPHIRTVNVRRWSGAYAGQVESR